MFNKLYEFLKKEKEEMTLSLWTSGILTLDRFLTVFVLVIISFYITFAYIIVTYLFLVTFTFYCKNKYVKVKKEYGKKGFNIRQNDNETMLRKSLLENMYSFLMLKCVLDIILIFGYFFYL